MIIYSFIVYVFVGSLMYHLSHCLFQPRKICNLIFQKLPDKRYQFYSRTMNKQREEEKKLENVEESNFLPMTTLHFTFTFYRSIQPTNTLIAKFGVHNAII